MCSLHVPLVNSLCDGYLGLCRIEAGSRYRLATNTTTMDAHATTACVLLTTTTTSVAAPLASLIAARESIFNMLRTGSRYHNFSVVQVFPRTLAWQQGQLGLFDLVL